jgi:hypothetical protein
MKKKSIAIFVLTIWVALSGVMMLSSLANPIRWDWEKFFSIESTTEDFAGINAFLTATNVSSWSPTVAIPFTTSPTVPTGFTFNANNRLEKLELSNRKLSGTLPIEIDRMKSIKFVE